MEDGLERPVWSLLPSELLLSIAEHLDMADISRLPAVCGGWSWALGRARRGCPPPPPAYGVTYVPLKSSPWLLLPNEDGDEAEYCDFLRLSESSGGVPKIRISPLPEIAGRICVGGSPDGWIVTVDIWLSARILNPLTREEFPLPPFSNLYPYDKMTPVYSGDGDGSICCVSFRNPILNCSFNAFRYGFIRRIILSSAPPHGIAFLMHGSISQVVHLAIARVGDQAWSPGLDHSKFRYEDIQDVVYNEKESKFYIVSLALLIVLDLKNYRWGSLKPPKATVLGSLRGLKLVSGERYIVFSSGGELLLVWRHFRTYQINDLQPPREMDPNVDDEDDDLSDIVREETTCIKVFKFDLNHSDGVDPSSSCWVRVKDLGDEAIFVGFNYSICISTSDKPWIRRNSVYFAEDSVHCKDYSQKYYARDGGIYDLKHKKIERFFSSNCTVFWPPPAWFRPSRIQFSL